jgi:hypothetical protein
MAKIHFIHVIIRQQTISAFSPVTPAVLLNHEAIYLKGMLQSISKIP